MTSEKTLRKISRVSTTLLLCIGTGCATIVSNSEYTLNVDCNEASSTVNVYKGKQRVSTATTPGQVSLSASGGFFKPAEYRFVFSKPGFSEDERKIVAKIDPWYFGNIVIGGFLGAGIVDPATGAMWKFPKDTTVKGRIRKDECVKRDDLPMASAKEKDIAPKVMKGINANEGKTDKVPKEDLGQSAVAQYRIVSCERESGKDFSYRFVLEIKDDSNDPLRMFRTIQKNFRAAIKEDYAESFSNIKTDSLFVDFPEYRQNNNRIEGRAVVLTIAVSSLAYDPNTRKGKLAVKVNANQYEEARKWIRKNIETLARDKNIALTTGEIPPAAKFYLGREELRDGNVLEIEFETE
ncbi:MAG: hypothetical protein ACI4R9_04100 [Kiritimatiellia bacterium]